MKKVVLLSFIVLAITQISSAQSSFQVAYGGTSTDVPYGTVIAPDGSYVIGGDTYSFNNDYNFYVTKLSATGTLIWTKLIGTSSAERANAIRNVPGGGFIAAGYRVFGPDDMFITKINDDGSLAWAKSYGSSAQTEQANDIQTTTDGGFVMGGITTNLSATNNIDMTIAKTNGAGVLQWMFGYAQTGFRGEEIYKIIQTADGNYTAVGRISDQDGSYHVVMLRINSTGSVLWCKEYTYSTFDEAVSVVATPDGGYMLTGNTSNGSDRDILVMKTDGSGNLIWANRYGTTADNRSDDIIRLVSGSFMVAGTHFAGPNTSSDNEIMMLLNPAGTIISINSYGGLMGEELLYGGLAQTGDGGLIFSGLTRSFGAGDNDVLVTKTNAAFSSGIVCDLLSPTFTTVALTTTVKDIAITATAYGVATDVAATSQTPATAIIAACQQVILPINTINLKATESGINAVQLSWDVDISGSAQTTGRFIVQKSNDGITFTDAGTISYAGQKQYNFKDNLPFSGANYYRIKFEDANGKILFSQVAIINLYSKKAAIVFSNGNPVQAGTNVQLVLLTGNITDKASTNLKVYDVSGRQVFSKPVNNINNSGNIQVSLPSAAWPGGMYKVVLQQGQTLPATATLVIN